MQRRFTLTLLAVFALAGCARNTDPTPQPAARAAQTVTAVTAATQDWPVSMEVQGQIAAWQEAMIGARVTGLPLVEVLVNVGDQVKQDQLLARLDDRTVKADLAQAKANLAQTAANARQTAANRERVRALKGSGAVSDQDIELAETQADTAEAQRLMAQAQVATQELRLQYCEVRAVDDGVISSRSATLGMVASAQGGSELFRLIRKARLEWRAELNATQLAQVQPGQSVQVTLTNGSVAKGRVRQLAPALDQTSRLGMAYVDIEPGSHARAAMYASGTIRLGTRPALVVPADAVVLRDGRASVFQLADNSKVHQVQVEVGRRDPKHIEIVNPLKAGDQVIERGAGFLADGDLVQLAKAMAEGGKK